MPTLGGAPSIKAQDVHPLYAKYRDIWRFYELSYHGGKDYLNPDIMVAWTWVSYSKGSDGKEYTDAKHDHLNAFLYPHDREDPAFFQARLRRSWYRNLCKPTLNAVRDHSLGESVDRKAGSSLAVEAVWKDVDHAGSSIDEWIAEGWTSALMMGHMFGVVDLPRFMPGEIATLKDEQTLGVRPYGTWYSPLQVPLWEIDRFGAFNMVCLLEQDLRPDAQPKTGDEETKAAAPLWRILYRDHWEVREGGPKGKVLDESENPLGRVPVEVLRAGKLPGVRDPIGVSFLEAIAPMNQQIYNTDSMRDAIKYAQAPFLAIPGGKGMSQMELGTSHGFGLPEGASSPSWVVMPEHAYNVYSDQIAEMTLAIRALAGLSRGKSEESIAARSGEALLAETQDKRAMLKRYRAHVQDFERRFATLVGDVAQQPWGGDAGGHVNYSDKYMVRSFTEELEESTKFLDLPLPDAVKNEELAKIIRRRLAHLGNDRVEEFVKLLEQQAAPEEGDAEGLRPAGKEAEA